MTAHGTFAPHEGEMDLDLSDLMAQAGATGVDGVVKAVYLTENGDPVMYLKLGFLSGLMPGGKPWMRVDLAKVGKAAGIDFNQLLGGAGQNPADSLQLLRGVGDFSEVGTEHVDGVDTTHYHGTIDLAKAAAARGISSDIVKRLLDLGAPSQYPADVWVDDAGYVRRFASTFDETVAGKTVSASMAIDMSDYGTTVDVSAPPADQVFDATDLASQGTGG
jgi:hypothetical protein